MIMSGFDVEDVSESGSDDLEGLDASAGHIANLLSSEPSGSMCDGFQCYSLLFFGLDDTFFSFFQYSSP